MTVEQTDVIDVIGIDTGGTLVLTISDHLGWESEAAHFELLEARLNAYLAFLESRQVTLEYPDSEGRRVALRVVTRFVPTAGARAFLEKVRVALELAGYELRTSTLDDDN